MGEAHTKLEYIWSEPHLFFWKNNMLEIILFEPYILSEKVFYLYIPF